MEPEEGSVGAKPEGRNGFVLCEEQKGPCDQSVMQVAQGRPGQGMRTLAVFGNRSGFHFEYEEKPLE